MLAAWRNGGFPIRNRPESGFLHHGIGIEILVRGGLPRRCGALKKRKQPANGFLRLHPVDRLAGGDVIHPPFVGLVRADRAVRFALGDHRLE